MGMISDRQTKTDLNVTASDNQSPLPTQREKVEDIRKYGTED
jgi:hypothetical protein